MKRDPLDILLQLAFLEGLITTHGLYEMSVGKRKLPLKASTGAKAALEKRLETALADMGEEASLTVGVFLRKNRTKQGLRPQEIFSRLGLSANIYKMLEQDRISPLKIPVDSWRKLREFFRFSRQELVEMIRRTHQLVWFRPSFRTTLARYDTRKNKSLKAPTLEQAARELYSKASLLIPPEEESKLKALFEALKESTEGR